MFFARIRAYARFVIRLISLALALVAVFAAPPGSAQSMVGYGLGVGAAGGSGGALKKSGQAVRGRLSALPVTTERTGFVGPPIPARDRRTEHELPIDFEQSSGVVRLFEDWSGPGDSAEASSAHTVVPAARPAAVEPSSSDAVWGRRWLGSTPEDLLDQFGKPVLSVAGNGGPEDRQITHRLPDGAKARFLIRSGVVVRANRY